MRSNGEEGVGKRATGLGLCGWQKSGYLGARRGILRTVRRNRRVAMRCDAMAQCCGAATW
jgi:hypothetical protein